MQCVFNRLTSDQTNYKVCYDTDPVGHGGVVADNSSNVVDWIASKTISAAEPRREPLHHASPLPTRGYRSCRRPDGGVETCYSLLSTF